MKLNFAKQSLCLVSHEHARVLGKQPLARYSCAGNSYCSRASLVPSLMTSQLWMVVLGSRLFHCIESEITLCARAPEKVILNLPSNGVGYIGHGCMRLETGCTIRQFTVSLYNSEVTPHYSHPMFQSLP